MGLHHETVRAAHGILEPDVGLAVGEVVGRRGKKVASELVGDGLREIGVVEGWVEKKRAGTPAAEAARKARDTDANSSEEG